MGQSERMLNVKKSETFFVMVVIASNGNRQGGGQTDRQGNGRPTRELVNRIALS